MPTNTLVNKLKSLLLTLSFLAYGAMSNEVLKDWKVISTDTLTTAIFTKNPIVKINLITESGEPRLISWSKLPNKKNIWSLKYFAGASGTSTLIESYRQVLILMPDGKFLIDMPYEYKVLGLNPEEQKRVNQPVWEWTKRGLKITDKDYPSNNVLMEFKEQL